MPIPPWMMAGSGLAVVMESSVGDIRSR
jgi:hypothetical protein